MINIIFIGFPPAHSAGRFRDHTLPYYLYAKSDQLRNDLRTQLEYCSRRETRGEDVCTIGDTHDLRGSC